GATVASEEDCWVPVERLPAEATRLAAGGGGLKECGLQVVALARKFVPREGFVFVGSFPKVAEPGDHWVPFSVAALRALRCASRLTSRPARQARICYDRTSGSPPRRESAHVG